MAITNGHTVDDVYLKVTKGNGLADLITEMWMGGIFQLNDAVLDTGKSAGMDVNKAIRVKKQVAVLGCRGDYVELVANTSTKGTTTFEMAVNALLVEGIDFTGIPTAVQHTVFGEFSPFVTPKSSMQESMLDGIDRQEVMFANNVATAVDGTAVSCKLRGETDARLKHTTTGAETAITKIALKLKPNSDGVFVIPAGAKLWAGYGTPT